MRDVLGAFVAVWALCVFLVAVWSLFVWTLLVSWRSRWVGARVSRCVVRMPLSVSVTVRDDRSLWAGVRVTPSWGHPSPLCLAKKVFCL